MRTLLRDVRPLGDGEAWPRPSSIVIEDGAIAAILDGTPEVDADHVIDGRGGLAIPGLFNGHAHNHELYLRGAVHGVPLEPYIVRNALRGVEPTPEEIYDRTLSACGEMLINGITAVADDVIHQDMRPEYVDAVFAAYEASGMRARVSLMVEDSPWRRSVPLDGAPPAPDPVLDAVRNEPAPSLRAYERLLALHEREGSRVRVMVSPSAPQRCSPGFLGDLVALARDHEVPFHVHVQETLCQYVVGPQMFDGRSMIAFLSDQGLLGPETTVAHAVWVDADDIRRLGVAGANVVHNPISNLKLGSGVAPVRELMDAGVNVVLGTDGLTCNDALDMLSVMKTAALVSTLTTPDHDAWLTPAEVLRMSTTATAAANRMGRIGALREGWRADVVVLDPDGPGFATRNDARTQLVFASSVRDVQHVLIDGRHVVDRGRCLTIDRPTVQRRVADAAERHLAAAAPLQREDDRLIPYVDRAYRRCVADAEALPVYRLVDRERRPAR